MKGHKTEAMDVLKKNARFLKKEFGVKRIFLFGSFAKGTARNESDIDLIVDLEKPLGLRFIEMADFLEEVLDCKVDIMTYRSFRRGFRIPRYKHIAEDINRSIIHVQSQG
ncbi:MAG: nucleotidyltransferase family protein [Candidatus Aminicenantes bacterium]|nr:nucleotidyltransferase family protein [Candidatus Aminicenantes bacterium]